MCVVYPTAFTGTSTQESNAKESSSKSSTYFPEGGVSTPSNYNAVIITKLGYNYLLQTFKWMETKQSHTCETIFYFHYVSQDNLMHLL